MQITRWIIYSPEKDGFYNKKRGYPYLWTTTDLCKMFINYSDAILICNELDVECHPVECKFNFNERTLKGKKEVKEKEYTLNADFKYPLGLWKGIDFYSGQKFTVIEEHPDHVFIRANGSLIAIEKSMSNPFFNSIVEQREKPCGS